MIKIQRILFLLAISAISLSLMGFSWPFTWMFPETNPYTAPVPVVTYAHVHGHRIRYVRNIDGGQWLSRETEILTDAAGNINTNVVRLSLVAYLHARARGYDRKELLTVVDYALPSDAKRLWVFDLQDGRVLYNTWVAHGRNSGGLYATSFSNQRGSLKSSLGVFVTDETYVGGDGYSLKVSGLEPGFNSNAYERDVIIHGARYVSYNTISTYGQAGRSWGCFALSPSIAAPIINRIKDNTIVFAYYPDRYWLTHSQFLVA